MNDDLYRYSHNAMNCPFEIIIHGHDEKYAGGAAAAMFGELDRVEEKLSRFVEWSDLGRIRVLEPGAFTVVNPETMNCLLSALWVYSETNGAYDFTLGQGVGAFLVDPAGMRVGIAPGVKVVPIIDLGGIGKGYALDHLADMLAEWDIQNAMLSAGGSTVLALGMNGGEKWSIGVNGQPEFLADMALSGSGKDVQGEHIVNPATGCPASGHERTWVMAPSAAVADALSTAFMVMDTDTVRRFCGAHEGIRAFVVNAAGDYLSV